MVGPFGKAFHLTLDYGAFPMPRDEIHVFTRPAQIDASLNEMSDDGLYGRNERFSSFTYDVRASHKFREDQLETVQP